MIDGVQGQDRFVAVLGRALLDQWSTLPRQFKSGCLNAPSSLDIAQSATKCYGSNSQNFFMITSAQRRNSDQRARLPRLSWPAGYAATLSRPKGR